MKNQDVHLFIRNIYTDWKVLYKDTIYFFDGWTEDTKSVLHVYEWKENSTVSKVEKDHVFEAPSMDECKELFLSTPMFEDNKTFWEVQQDMEIIDD